MHAFLISGADQNNIDTEINKIIGKGNSNKLNFAIDTIEKVRELSDHLRLVQPQDTFILINDVDEITTESANAFLKSLEEPNKNVTFILTCKNEYKVIPTILSRCQTIRLLNVQPQMSNKENEEIDTFLNSSVGEKLNTVAKIRKREEAIPFVEGLIRSLHSKLLAEKRNLPLYADYLESAQATLENLKANGNVTIQLTNLVSRIQLSENSNQ